MENITLKGISAPVLTPFETDGRVNLKEYERLVGYITGCGIHGIFVGGTSGEFVNLDIEERKNLLVAAKNSAKSDTVTMFNITAMNLTDLKELIGWAKANQADAVSVTAPYYHQYDSKALVSYFQKVSELTGELPLYLYNMSGMTNNPITPAILSEVARTCENVKGVKDSSMDFMTFLNYQTVISSPEFEIITGNDAQVLPSLLAGGAGAIIAIASVFPALSLSIWDNYQKGKMEEAKKSQATILLVRELFRSVMPTIAHKKALELRGFNMGPARFPFRDLTLEESSIIEFGLHKLNLL